MRKTIEVVKELLGLLDYDMIGRVNGTNFKIVVYGTKGITIFEDNQRSYIVIPSGSSIERVITEYVYDLFVRRITEEDEDEVTILNFNGIFIQSVKNDLSERLVAYLSISCRSDCYLMGKFVQQLNKRCNL